jgi:hypothetical protein
MPDDGPYVIDVQATITAVHQAFAVAQAMPEGPEREGLIRSANGALGLCGFYLRHPKVYATKTHYDSVQELLATLARVVSPTPA